jgi:hypothetical protein
MASLVYNSFKAANAKGDIQLDDSDIRARLLMTNTTCDTENDGIVNIDDFTTVDPSDATSYADVQLQSKDVTVNDAYNRAEFTATNISFTGLGGDATRDYQGVLLYVRVDGTDENDLVVAFVEFDNQPLAKEATQVDVPWDAEGIMQLA